jgi:uncharacterized glyoxalase superfamily protein PhnB
MTQDAQAHPRAIPTLRCREAKVAIAWLGEAFGVDQDYGGRGYSCRDPERHLWSFGSYDPQVE